MHGGYQMQLPVASSQTWTAAFVGCYAEHHVAVLEPYIRPGTIVLDIGASLGLFTVPAARAARGRGATLWAYEPVPQNVEYVRANVRRNQLDAVVTVRPVGLGTVPGRLDMLVEGRGAGNATVTSGLSTDDLRRHGTRGGLAESVSVPVLRLDDEDLPPCSAIKIDVEGREIDVLASGEAMILRDRPVILGEFSPQWMQSRGLRPDAAAQWAADHGYTLFEFPAEHRRPWRETSFGPPVPSCTSPTGDVLLVPSEKLPPG